MWETISRGEEIFVYVNNRAKNGDHYWVLAHVTPDFNQNGEIIGYHSNRRVPRRSIIGTLQSLYDRLAQIERSHASSKDGLAASTRALKEFLAGEGKSYAEFVLAL
jgi:hypothetical protein